MNEYTILRLLAAHVWLVVGLALVGLIILLLPYNVITVNRSGRYCRIRALLWTWECTPNYTRLHMFGLLYLQRALLHGLYQVLRLVKGSFLTRVTDIRGHRTTEKS